MPPRTFLNFQPRPCPGAYLHPLSTCSFGVSENKVIFSDCFGDSFLYNAGVPCIATMPSLYMPKERPISISVLDQDGAGSVYILESRPKPRRDNKGYFEAFVYAKHPMYHYKSWEQYSLPPPPFVLQPGYDRPAQIISYAVLGGGSHLCISATGWGTYCFDTVSKEWSHVGYWMLPISGKAEYVPDLGLWFGKSREGYLPCTSDLSPALNGHEPELRCKWETRFLPPWTPHDMSQMVNLGSGRFFTYDNFQTRVPNPGATRYDEPVIDFIFPVFSGLELKPGPSDHDQPQLIFHKSKIVGTDDKSSMLDNLL